MCENQYRKILPTAVKGGIFEGNGITLVSSLGEHRLLWEELEFLLLARIEEITQITVQKESPKGISFRGNLSQHRPKEEVKKNMKQSELFAAYLYVKNQEKPFRFDTIATNFKEMLGSEGGFSGWANFNLVFRRIIESSPNLRLDPSAAGFMQTGKKQIKTYSSKDQALLQASKLSDRKDMPKLPADETAKSESSEEVYKFSLDD